MTHDEWRAARYSLFNKKIDYFKDHEKYPWLRQYADNAIIANEMSGWSQIQAADFIKRIEKMPLDYIGDWLDEKNMLEWPTAKSC